MVTKMKYTDPLNKAHEQGGLIAEISLEALAHSVGIRK